MFGLNLNDFTSQLHCLKLYFAEFKKSITYGVSNKLLRLA
ncbi:hypothetical protein BCEN4_740067 [Burkholderia cenocepacia]|nr:hypothetical protein BCEN4_740067 [Burkholderia cenocepacia]